MTEEECDRAYLDVVLRWPCYGSMLYEVEQTYTSSVARNLWLAVNLEGISLIARGEKVRVFCFVFVFVLVLVLVSIFECCGACVVEHVCLCLRCCWY